MNKDKLEIYNKNPVLLFQLKLCLSLGFSLTVILNMSILID